MVHAGIEHQEVQLPLQPVTPRRQPVVRPVYRPHLFMRDLLHRPQRLTPRVQPFMEHLLGDAIVRLAAPVARMVAIAALPLEAELQRRIEPVRRRWRRLRRRRRRRRCHGRCIRLRRRLGRHCRLGRLRCLRLAAHRLADRARQTVQRAGIPRVLQCTEGQPRQRALQHGLVIARACRRQVRPHRFHHLRRLLLQPLPVRADQVGRKRHHPAERIQRLVRLPAALQHTLQRHPGITHRRHVLDILVPLGRRHPDHRIIPSAYGLALDPQRRHQPSAAEVELNLAIGLPVRQHHVVAWLQFQARGNRHPQPRRVGAILRFQDPRDFHGRGVADLLHEGAGQLAGDRARCGGNQALMPLAVVIFGLARRRLTAHLRQRSRKAVVEVEQGRQQRFGPQRQHDEFPVDSALPGHLRADRGDPQVLVAGILGLDAVAHLARVDQGALAQLGLHLSCHRQV